MAAMEIYILRHGIAENKSASGRDADRALTADGRRKLRDVLSCAQRAGVKPELILTSPFVRAVETAAIAAELLGYSDAPLRTDSLIPESDPEAVWEELCAHRSCASVVLASHEPLVSRFVSFALGAPSLEVDMKKGALVRVDVEGFRSPPHGILKWMLVPKLAS